MVDELKDSTVSPDPVPSRPDPISKEKYDSLRPFEQGFVSYMQGSWNKDIPYRCPYDENSNDRMYDEWCRGEQAAINMTTDDPNLYR